MSAHHILLDLEAEAARNSRGQLAPQAPQALRAFEVQPGPQALDARARIADLERAAETIMNTFAWYTTPEGAIYWSEVHLSLLQIAERIAREPNAYL